MNIPYDKFYAAELNNSVSVDVFSLQRSQRQKQDPLPAVPIIPMQTEVPLMESPSLLKFPESIFPNIKK